MLGRCKRRVWRERGSFTRSWIRPEGPPTPPLPPPSICLPRDCYCWRLWIWFVQWGRRLITSTICLSPQCKHAVLSEQTGETKEASHTSAQIIILFYLPSVLPSLYLLLSPLSSLQYYSHLISLPCVCVCVCVCVFVCSASRSIALQNLSSLTFSLRPRRTGTGPSSPTVSSHTLLMHYIADT